MIYLLRILRDTSIPLCRNCNQQIYVVLQIDLPDSNNLPHFLEEHTVEFIKKMRRFAERRGESVNSLQRAYNKLDWLFQVVQERHDFCPENLPEAPTPSKRKEMSKTGSSFSLHQICSSICSFDVCKHVTTIVCHIEHTRKINFRMP